MVAHTCNPSTWQVEADGSECQDLRLLTSSLCLRFSWASLPSTQDQNQVEESQVPEMQLHGVITLKPRSSGTAFENEEVLKPYSVAVPVSTCFWSFTAPPALSSRFCSRHKHGLCLLPCLCLYHTPSYPLLVAAPSGTAPPHSSVFLEGLLSTES